MALSCCRAASVEELGRCPPALLLSRGASPLLSSLLARSSAELPVLLFHDMARGLQTTRGKKEGFTPEHPWVVLSDGRAPRGGG